MKQKHTENTIILASLNISKFICNRAYRLSLRYSRCGRIKKLLVILLIFPLIGGCERKTQLNEVVIKITSAKLENVKTISTFDPIFTGRKITVMKIVCDSVVYEGKNFENKTPEECLNGASYFGRSEDGREIIRNYVLEGMKNLKSVKVFLDHEHGCEDYIIDDTIFIKIQLSK